MILLYSFRLLQNKLAFLNKNHNYIVIMVYAKKIYNFWKIGSYKTIILINDFHLWQTIQNAHFFSLIKLFFVLTAHCSSRIYFVYSKMVSAIYENLIELSELIYKYKTQIKMKIVRPNTQKIKTRCSNVTFLSEITNEKIKKCLSKLKQGKFGKSLSSKQWQYNFDEYSKSNMDELISISKKLLINFFSLHFCKQKNILKEINHIEFAQLTNLYLDGNKINSIQSLSTLQAPKLTSLSLGRNNIVSLRALERCNFPQLSLLFLSQIKVPCLESFFNNTNLAKIQLLHMYHCPNMVNWQNVVKKQMKDIKKCRITIYKVLQPVDVALKFQKRRHPPQLELQVRIYDIY